MACDDHEFIRLTPLSIALLSYLQHHCCILQLHFFVIFIDLYQPLPYNVWLKQAGFNRSILCRRKKKWLSNAPFFCVSMHTGWSRKPGLTEKLISVLNKVSGFVKPIKRAWQCWTSFTTTSFTRMHINMYHQPPQNRSNFFYVFYSLLGKEFGNFKDIKTGLPIPLCEAVVPHRFISANKKNDQVTWQIVTLLHLTNQQRPWASEDFTVLPEFRKLGFWPMPNPTSLCLGQPL